MKQVTQVFFIFFQWWRTCSVSSAACASTEIWTFSRLCPLQVPARESTGKQENRTDAVLASEVRVSCIICCPLLLLPHLVISSLLLFLNKYESRVHSCIMPIYLTGCVFSKSFNHHETCEWNSADLFSLHFPIQTFLYIDFNPDVCTKSICLYIGWLNEAHVVWQQAGFPLSFHEQTDWKWVVPFVEKCDWAIWELLLRNEMCRKSKCTCRNGSSVVSVRRLCSQVFNFAVFVPH